MSTESPWNAAPQDYAIDPLVSVLKDTRRWNTDGRSLRELNKHWCAAISLHVERVCPQRFRKLDFKDIDSLLKFPNVTEVDTTAFESEGLREKNCRRLSDVLGSLPRLQSLTVDLFFDYLADRHLRQLPKFVEIKCEDMCSRFFFSGISYLPVRHLKGQFHFKDLCDWIPRMMELETLEVKGFRHPFDGDVRHLIDCTRHVKDVDLLSVPENLLNLLPQFHNLAALVLIRDLDPQLLVDLSRLTGLTWMLDNVDRLRSPAFRHVAMKLESLELQPFRRSHLPDGVLTGSLTLKELKLEGFHLSQSSIDDILSIQLTSLDLKRWDAERPFAFSGSATSLEALSYANTGNQIAKDLDISSLRNLRKLDVMLKGCFENEKLIFQILCLTRLEILKLVEHGDKSGGPEALEFVRGLNCLPRLTTLHCSFGVENKAFQAILRSSALRNLERLTIRQITESLVNFGWIKSTLNKLLSKAPYLRLTVIVNGIKIIENGKFRNTGRQVKVAKRFRFRGFY